ncbi:MAG TPA: hypothetical protein VMS88_00505, partial [Terriglobales bacterium]|nr:hypothetical protein [Terriglobales bacterium]
MASAFGPAAACLVHYGSHVHGAEPAPESAQDFFVIVEAYAPAYRALALEGALHRPAWLAAGLNRILPPNVIGIRAGTGLAKCAVLRWRDLESGCSARPRDHFVRARLFQQVEITWARDAAARARAATAIAAARAGTFRWIRPFLPAVFGAGGYAETLLQVSFAAEIRPEDESRPARLAAAQGGTLLPVYGALLDDLAARGVLAREGAEYREP